jgi:hypothetical protein
MLPSEMISPAIFRRMAPYPWLDLAHLHKKGDEKKAQTRAGTGCTLFFRHLGHDVPLLALSKSNNSAQIFFSLLTRTDR